MLLLIGNRLWGLNVVMSVSCFNNVATVLKYQGELKQAKEYYERALAIRRQTLEPQHPDVATSYNNLATVLRDHGDLKKA